MMNFKKFLSSAMALSLVASLPVFAAETTEYAEYDLDEQVFQSPDMGVGDYAEHDLDEQVFDSPDMGVGDMGLEDMSPDMGVGGETGPSVEEEELLEVPDFPDVPEEFWGYRYINDAVARGFFSGYPDGNFGPGDTLTRAQFTVVMLNIRKAELVDKVDGDSWEVRYYDTALQHGMIPETFSSENFNEEITREEMAAMAILTLGQGNFEIPTGNTQEIADFSDITEFYQGFVTLSYQEGLMSGKNTGFDPSGTSLRAEAAVVAMNVYNYVSEQMGGNTDSIPQETNPVSLEYIALLNSVREEEEAQAIPAFGAAEPMWEFIHPMFGFDDSNVEGFAVATRAMMVQAYCVALVKPVEGKEAEVMAGIESYQATQIDNFTGYLFDQLEFAENAIIETLADGSILLAMGETAQATADAVKAALA